MTTVKFKDLKARAVVPAYAGRGEKEYTPVPHHLLLMSVHTAWEGPKLTFATRLSDDGAVMTSTACADAASGRCRPFVAVVSSHTGRHPAEAFFGHRFEAGIDILTSRHTVARRHSKLAVEQVGDWGQKVADTLARGGLLAGRVKKWWIVRKGAPLGTERIEAFAASWSGHQPPYPAKTMYPFGVRGLVERLLAEMDADAAGLGKTEAGLLAAAFALAGEGPLILRAALRRYGLFLRLSSLAPPDVYGD